MSERLVLFSRSSQWTVQEIILIRNLKKTEEWRIGSPEVGVAIARLHKFVQVAYSRRRECFVERAIPCG